MRGLSVQVVRKAIKNLHLSVHPPTGRVTISAPKGMDLEIIRLFAISKLGWIRRHKQKFNDALRLTPVDGEGVWTGPYLQSFAYTIGGGTTDIQRNIVGERVLGLPRA